MSSTGNKFCIDTSALITAFRFVYPPKTFATLWENIEDAVSKDLIISPSTVLDELKRKDDSVLGWARKQRRLFRKETAPVMVGMKAVLKVAPSLVDVQSDREQADPFVIAMAQHEKRIVVTEEKLVGPGAIKTKIPNVCQTLKIQCVTFLDMVQLFGWKL